MTFNCQSHNLYNTSHQNSRGRATVTVVSQFWYVTIALVGNYLHFVNSCHIGEKVAWMILSRTNRVLN